MFDLGWSELLLIGVVALIVVGPKDLPEMFRTLGRFTGKARAMARDFQRAMNEAAEQSGVNEATKGLKDIANPKAFGLDAVKNAADRFEKWDPKITPTPAKTPPEPLSEERAEIARKIHDSAAARASARIAAQEAADTAEPPPAKGGKTPVKKTAARKPAARKPAAKADSPADGGAAKKAAPRKRATTSGRAKPAGKTDT